MHRGLSAWICLSFAMGVIGCGGSGSQSDPSCNEDDPRGPVLASIGESIIVPRQRSFAQLAEALESATSAAAATPEDAPSLASARAAWQDAIDAWQRVEVMQVGPAANRSSSQGGLGLRNRIYSWDDMNNCLLNKQTIGESYDDPAALGADAATQRGLWAIEYLLFNEDSDNECSELDEINEQGTWDDMLSELPERRLRHAASLATLVRQSAEELVQHWAPEGEDFIEELEAPCRSGALYGSPQEGLNELSNALFYLDTETKDMKLGQPADLSAMLADEDDCPAMGICPAVRESRWANHSKENIVANLRGFQEIFLGAEPGTEAPGFDDLLVDMGAGRVATDMSNALSEAIAKTEAIPGSLAEALESDLPAVEQAYEATKAVTDILKTDFLTVLDLEAPDRAAGDND